MHNTFVSVHAACAYCGAEFTKTRPHHLFCRNACRIRAHRKKHGIAEPDFSTMKSVKIHRERHRQSNSHNRIKEIEIGFQELFLREEQEKKRLLKRIRIIEQYVGNTLPRKADHERIRALGLQPMLYESNLGKFIDGFISAGKKHVPKGEFSDLDNFIPDIVLQKQELEAEILRCREEIDRIDTQQQHRREERSLAKGQVTQVPTPVTLSNPSIHTAPTAVRSSTAAELAQATTSPLLLPLTGMYETLFGASIGMAPYIVVWGDAGSGKTSFVLRFLRYLQNIDSVAFCSAEMPVQAASPLIGIARRAGATHIPLKETPSIELFSAVLQENAYQFVALDSASRLQLSAEQMLALRNTIPTRGLIVLLESTKNGGSFKGDNAWKHHCNIMVRVEATWNDDGSRRGSRFVVEKNQWGVHGSWKVKYRH